MKTYILFTFLFITILSYLSIHYLEDSKNSTIETLNKQKLLTSKATYNAVIDTYSIAAIKDFNEIMKNKEVLKLLHRFKYATKKQQNIIRGKLYRLLYKDYEDMKELYIRQFHFHTFNGKSLLRFNIPYINGDYLSNFRYSVRIANTKLKRVIGYEAGRLYPAYRYVFPIIYKNEHLGSVEFSISFDGIDKKMHDLLPRNNYQQIMTKNSTIDSVFKSNYHFFSPSKFSKNYYIESPEISNSTRLNNDNKLIKKITIFLKNSKNLEKKLQQHKDFSLSFIENEKGYSVNFISFNDTTNRHAGYIVAYNRLDEITRITQKYALYDKLVLFFAILFFILIVIILKQIEKSRLFKNELIDINNSLKEAQSIAHFGSWEIDLLDETFYWSDEVYNIFEIEPQSIKITKDMLLSYIYPDDVEKLTSTFNESLKDKKKYKLRHRIITKGGKIKYVEEYAYHKYNQNGTPLKSIGTIYDITEQTKSYLKLEKFVDLQHSIVILTDGHNFEFANKSFFTFFGYDNLKEFTDKYRCICELFIKKDGFFSLSDVKDKEENWVVSLLNLSERKRIVSMMDTTDTPHAFLVAITNYDEEKYIIDFSDISETMQEKLQLQNQVNNDQLTNTYNRVFFETSIHKIIQKHQQQNISTAIIFFDIDHFKKINDTFGHAMGDKVLISLTKLVKNTIRKDDYLIRWGGEEFIIITSAKNIDDVKHMAEYLRVSIEKLYVEGVGYFSCSFGVAIRKNNEKTITTIARADERLYEAKNSGRNTVR